MSPNEFSSVDEAFDFLCAEVEERLDRVQADVGNAVQRAEYEKAQQYLQRAKVLTTLLADLREIDDRWDEGDALGNLINAFRNLGEVQKAIDFFEQALAIAQEIGDRRMEGNALGNLGRAYADLGDMRQAIGYYQQALAISREIGDRGGEGNALANLGLA